MTSKSPIFDALARQITMKLTPPPLSNSLQDRRHSATSPYGEIPRLMPAVLPFPSSLSLRDLAPSYVVTIHSEEKRSPQKTYCRGPPTSQIASI